MKEIISCIEQLRLKLDKHRREDIKEIPTRTIFIDSLMKSLGWNVTETDEVELEFPTIDGKSVDYATKINHKPVLFIEAKPLNDSLTDVKAITQVVGYATNAGVEWCILTNGANYKVYRSTEKAEAPDKLLFEVSIDPKESEGKSVQQIAEQFNRFSRDSMAKGVLDEIGEHVFTMGKIRKALDKLFANPPENFIKIVRSFVGEESITPTQIKTSLSRLWTQSSEVPQNLPIITTPPTTKGEKQRGEDYGEDYHLEGKPKEVIELFRTIDKFCRELSPNSIQKENHKKYIGYKYKKAIFCSINIQKSGLRIYLKLNYSRLENPPDYVRDVSKIGHWGVGDVELAIDSIEELDVAKSFIRQSFDYK
jgi:predicted transport protein